MGVAFVERSDMGEALGAVTAALNSYPSGSRGAISDEEMTIFLPNFLGLPSHVTLKAVGNFIGKKGLKVVDALGEKSINCMNNLGSQATHRHNDLQAAVEECAYEAGVKVTNRGLRQKIFRPVIPSIELQHVFTDLDKHSKSSSGRNHRMGITPDSMFEKEREGSGVLFDTMVVDYKRMGDTDHYYSKGLGYKRFGVVKEGGGFK